MNARKKLDALLEKILIVLTAAMVLDVTWQVISRYVVGKPSTFTDELAGFLLIWVGLLGAAYATGKGQHLAIDLLPSKLEGIKKRNLLILISTLTALFACLVMVLGGANLVYLTFLLEQRSASLKVPLGYIYSCVPISGILIVYYTSSDIYQKLTQKTA